MGREVRRVPADWVHPEGVSLLDGFSRRHAKWKLEEEKWNEGLMENFAASENCLAEPKWIPKCPNALKCRSFADWDGPEPDPTEYMPDWPESERTHYQMYETCSEGSPISPVMESPEALARWLADNGASSFGSMTATYEQWLVVCRGNSAPSMVMALSSTGSTMMSGVEAIAELEKAKKES